MKSEFLQTVSPLPSHLIVELTHHCNYHCPYCYCVWHEFPELARRDLSAMQWKSLLDFLFAHGVNNILFTGGEALMRRDAFDIMAYAREKAPNAELSLFTNGSRLFSAPDSILRWFKRKRIRLSTSLQGIHTYGEMTGTRRTCFNLLSLLERAKRMGWPFAVSVTVTKVNAPELPDIFSAAAIAGASVIQMGVVMMEGRAKFRLDLGLTAEEWNACKMAVRAMPNCGVPYSFCDERICQCREDLPEDLIRDFGDPNFKPCTAGHDFGVIGPDGRYRRCLHLPVAYDIFK